MISHDDFLLFIYFFFSVVMWIICLLLAHTSSIRTVVVPIFEYVSLYTCVCVYLEHISCCVSSWVCLPFITYLYFRFFFSIRHSKIVLCTKKTFLSLPCSLFIYYYNTLCRYPIFPVVFCRRLVYLISVSLF